MSSPERPSPFVPVVLAWLLPGAGHWKLGRVWPGAFVFGGVVPLFVLGMMLAGYENVSHERHLFYFIIHAFAGLPAIVADLTTADVTITQVLPYREVGVLFSAVAGLLNLIALSDVWARCVRGDPEEMAARLKARTNPLAPENIGNLVAGASQDSDDDTGEARDPAEAAGV
jgi:hypothetical protein